MTNPAQTMLVTPENAEVFKSQFEALFGSSKKNGNEISIAAEGPLISGTAEVYHVRPGMQLFAMNMEVREDVELDIEPANSGVLVSLVLDGSSGYSAQPKARRQEQWEFLPGRTIVGTFRPEKCRWNVAAGDSHRLVELQIASGRAAKLVSEYLEATSGSVHPILSQPGGFPRHIRQALMPELRMVAHQVLNCSLEGAARKLFMESKALEILAFQFQTLSSPRLPESSTRSRAERERLEEARRILETEFADPPSLLTLARRVGLNDFKLKRGFRELYQTTVFGYVRSLRMENARALLEAGEMNVGEVAAHTGYTCFGHFSEAFRKRFGISPRDFKKGRRP
jgi:AraC-like DNA-binding protein